jgi:dTDP-4-dehydrorhamnose reductase
MRALVLGASGQIGAALVDQLRRGGHDAVGTHAHVQHRDTLPLDITNTDATGELITRVAPDCVFCPAGLTHVDYCEDHPEEAFSVNRDAPAAAAQLAAARGAGFVYFSTEYVFDGTAGPYGEEDSPRPISVYGASKLEGERAVCAANPRALVVRTTVVYGIDAQGKNFIYQLRRRLGAGERMRIPNDQVSSPTYNADLVAATVEAVERGVTGVVNLVGDGILDRHAFARQACDVFHLDADLLDPVPTAALGQRAPRPLRAGLTIDRARAMLRTPLRGPGEGLRAMRATLESAGTARCR